MQYPVCNLWLILTKKYKRTQPFKRFSKEYSLPYQKVREYGTNKFKKVDVEFIKQLCAILNCEFDDLIVDDEREYLSLRKVEKMNYTKSKKGVVYFVKNADGYTKIGRTSHLKHRLSNLRYEERGEGLNLIHFIETEDTHTLEKTLHKVFSDKCISGEWFALTDEDLAKIKG